MQKCFLVSNKTTQVKEYLEHRSIVEIVEEYKGLSDLDITRLGIVDVDKFVYMHYEIDDNDMSIRSDLNVFRALLSSAFFHTREAIFILVACKNPMLEDLIRSACRDSSLIGDKLSIFHHSGTLTLHDVGKYITGDTYSSDSISSSYRTVYIREEDRAERERYVDAAGELDTILPKLTDQYAMYRRRSDVEAVSSGGVVSDPYNRPAVLNSFAEIEQPTSRDWTAFLVSGERYTLFQKSINSLVDYFGRVGYRPLVVDFTARSLCSFDIDVKRLSLQELQHNTVFSERVAFVKAKFNQLGYIVEMLPNIVGVHRYVFVCDSEDYDDIREFLQPLGKCYNNFVTHYAEEPVREYLDSGRQATTLFLSTAFAHVPFDLTAYKERFEGQRVALFDHECKDSTEHYECAIGGVTS